MVRTKQTARKSTGRRVPQQDKDIFLSDVQRLLEHEPKVLALILMKNISEDKGNGLCGEMLRRYGRPKVGDLLKQVLEDPESAKSATLGSATLKAASTERSDGNDKFDQNNASNRSDSHSGDTGESSDEDVVFVSAKRVSESRSDERPYKRSRGNS
ncbi:uncharacterized protein B0I36DRAFT_356580 [Microdochium trichocladiopsis]|uniref:Uncharacterized protein n=1 Tax=Microdochium trichocladiopsis TaxID=1682393 RepID=A0A9P8XSZ5_9PEZI|nr:uncharacterized protein B0I36DRAFT_356580 [Microdochium trichocladiopsis]KAH7010678.1 hypothetical protein B0I36DRAFT_356580 [Microdochium trichocladiopsis]